MKKPVIIIILYFLSFVSYGNITDTEPPIWTTTIPALSTIECPATPNFIQMTATDNSGTVTVTYTDQTFLGACAGSYSVTRTWMATDPSGNSITAAQTINVIDNSSPVFNSFPGNITISCDEPMPVAPTLIAVDNCGVANVTFSEETIYMPNDSGHKTIIRSWSAYDNCGNTTVHSQTITVNIPTTPTVISIIEPSCANPATTVTIGGLPSTNWTLTIFTNTTDLIVLNGNTPTVTVNLAPELYSALVSTSTTCSSNIFNIYANGFDLIDYAMQGTYQDYNNDGFVNVGDIIHYEFSITNNACIPISDVVINSATLAINGQLQSLAGQTTDSTTFSANYVLTQANINSGSITHSSNVQVTHPLLNSSVYEYATSTIQLNTSDGIMLNAFLDSNNNGVQDNGELNVNYGNFTYQINNGSSIINTSSNGKLYLYESNPTSIYNINYNLSSYYTNCFTTAGLIYSNVSVPVGSGITVYNFPITSIPCTNVSVHFSSYNSPRPGNIYQNTITITNNGNQLISSGTLTFNSDPTLTILNISVTGTTPITNGFTYNYTNLAPGQTISIIVNMQVPTIPTVSLGQIVTNSVSITTPNEESWINDNLDSLSQTIIGPYDPNDKQESHGGQIVHSTFTIDDYLTYTIRFENTGTANAINVKVEDVLDSQLDENTIRMVAASHNYVLERVGSNLTWKFDGINLPPSVPDTQIGHGFITFQIKPKAGFAIGDIIPNTAEIYFDFNPAIVTNTCTTEFVETLGNDNFAFANLNYFPNPVKNSLTISNSSLIDSIEITSILGRNILSQKVNSLQTEINLSELSSGIYFVKVTSEGQEKTIKIVKE
ncbi:MAG: T9SS type A sorting domain-containing protein [Flavobacterium sp.]|nr:T9SS type A sorting domain-containing protein [Flavobacterium sp.]